MINLLTSSRKAKRKKPEQQNKNPYLSKLSDDLTKNGGESAHLILKLLLSKVGV